MRLRYYISIRNLYLMNIKVVRVIVSLNSNTSYYNSEDKCRNAIILSKSFRCTTTSTNHDYVEFISLRNISQFCLNLVSSIGCDIIMKRILLCSHDFRIISNYFSFEFPPLPSPSRFGNPSMELLKTFDFLILEFWRFERKVL